MKRIIAMAVATAALSGAVMAGEVNLRTLAVEDGSGNLVVLWDEHTSGWWAGNQYTPFDGLTSTSYIGAEYSRTPTYDWKFSNVNIHASKGLAITVQ